MSLLYTYKVESVYRVVKPEAELKPPKGKDEHMQKWEYMTLSLLPDEKQVPQWTDAPEDNRSASERLNELGEEGWELVSVAQHIEGDRRRTVYWLKRPVE